VSNTISTEDSRTEFVKLLTGSQRALHLYIVTFLPRVEDAEDVLQSVNAVLWEKVDCFEPGTNFLAWARRIAYYEILGVRRKMASKRLLFDTELVSLLSEEMSEPDTIDLRRRALGGCIRKLRGPDREVLALRYEDAHSVASIAEELGRPVKSIYRSLERIRMALLHCIDKTVAMEGRK
jgi:RNA polymerase sigma-70 factor (ECF subfamily)